MSVASRPALRLAVATTVAAGYLASASLPAKAADLALHEWRARPAAVERARWTWLDRCAYAGQYCLYTEYGYVYHYPFDDRPIAQARYRRFYR